MTQKLWLMLCFVLLPSLAQGQTQEWDVSKVPGLKHEKKCHPGDPTRCVIFLRKGEIAPFDGALQTPTQAAIVATRADPERLKERVAEAVKTQKDLDDNDLKLEKRLREIDNDAWKEKLSVTESNYDERVKRLEGALPSWYEEPWFVAGSTFVVTVVAVGVTVHIANELRGGS